MKVLPVLIATLVSLTAANAQVAEKALDNFRRLKNISYDVRSAGRNIFTGELFIDTSTAFLTHGKDGNWIFRRKGKKEDNWFFNYKSVKLDLTEKSYRIKSDTMKRGYYALPKLAYLMEQLEISLDKKQLLISLPDTTINGKSCHKIRVTTFESEARGKRLYNQMTVAIEKASLLPYAFRQEGAGFIDGTDVYVNQLDDYLFFNYQANSKSFPDIPGLLLPADFTADVSGAKQIMLGEGTEAPDIRLTDLQGNESSLSGFRGKSVLLVFTDNGCGYCAMSIDPVNHLYAAYKDRNLEVVNVNAFDTPEAIRTYNGKYNVRYNSYKPGESALRDYHVQGYPKFYVIDPAGRINKSYSGFSSTLQQDLAALINATMP